jgi:hypothetical protein
MKEYFFVERANQSKEIGGFKEFGVSKREYERMLNSFPFPEVLHLFINSEKKGDHIVVAKPCASGTKLQFVMCEDGWTADRVIQLNDGSLILVESESGRYYTGALLVKVHKGLYICPYERRQFKKIFLNT